MKDLDLKSKYSDILSSNQIKNEIAEVIIKIPENLVGEHMGSICEYVTIKFEGGKREPKELFLKRQLPTPNNPEMDAMFKKTMITEGTFLTTFVSQMTELCEQKLGPDNDVEIDTLFPKTYFADDSELIMENMATKGYFMLNKTELQNFEMASLVMKSLAKLHGVSCCLVKRAGGKDAFVEKNPTFTEMMSQPDVEEMFSNMFDPTLKSILKMMEEFSDSIEISEASKKLKAYEGKLAKSIIEVVFLPNLFENVNHGDCWNNNMMFSPETRKNPELAKLLFVDFQIGRVGSPCLDLGYYIFTSTKPEVRKRIKELLKIYFDALKDLIERLGEVLPYTFEEFLIDYGVKSKMGFLFGVMMSVAMEAIKGHDTHKSGGSIDEEFTNLMTNWIKENPDKAREIVEGVKEKVKDFEVYGKL